MDATPTRSAPPAARPCRRAHEHACRQAGRQAVGHVPQGLLARGDAVHRAVRCDVDGRSSSRSTARRSPSAAAGAPISIESCRRSRGRERADDRRQPTAAAAAGLAPRTRCRRASPPPEPPHRGLRHRCCSIGISATALEAIVGSDPSWTWQRTGDAEWQAVGDAGDIASAPRSDAAGARRAVAAASVDGHARAALVAADPLTLALGRPNREQVVTRARPRADHAAGAGTDQRRDALHACSTEGARAPAGRQADAGALLVARIYRRALGRDPTPAEAKARVARSLGVAPLKADGDAAGFQLIWARRRCCPNSS